MGLIWGGSDVLSRMFSNCFKDLAMLRLVFLCAFVFGCSEILPHNRVIAQGDVLCGFIYPNSWDCSDLPWSGIGACEDECDWQDPVCNRWFGGSQGPHNGLPRYSSMDRNLGVNVSYVEVGVEYVSCGSITVCASNCVLDTHGVFKCTVSPYVPAIPQGGFHYFNKGACPPRPPLNPVGGGNLADL